MKLPKFDLNRRDKELILANLVIWGSIIIALALAISLISDRVDKVDLPRAPVSEAN